MCGTVVAVRSDQDCYTSLGGINVRDRLPLVGLRAY